MDLEPTNKRAKFSQEYPDGFIFPRDIWKYILQLRWELIKQTSRKYLIKEHKKKMMDYFELRSSTYQIRWALDTEHDYWKVRFSHYKRTGIHSCPKYINGTGLVYDWLIVDYDSDLSYIRFKSVEDKYNYIEGMLKYAPETDQYGAKAPDRWRRPAPVTFDHYKKTE